MVKGGLKTGLKYFNKNYYSVTDMALLRGTAVMTKFIIHQVFSLARDWSKLVT